MLSLPRRTQEYIKPYRVQAGQLAQWVFKNKKDKRSIVVKNKARLVAQGFRQEEGIDYDEVLAPVARIEAIKLFLSFASYMGFTVYQIDVKSAFLYGNNGGAMHQQIIIHHSSCGSDVLGGRWSNDIECRTSKL
ncbi:copia protein [Tanacetum coccineum]